MGPLFIMSRKIFVFACLVHLTWTVHSGEDLIMDPTEYIYDCDSKVFCRGPLLETIQLSRVFPNSEIFVNMKMHYSPDQILARFKDLNERVKNLTKKPAEVGKFLVEYFAPDKLANSWLRDSTNFSYDMKSIKDEIYREFLESIYRQWDELVVETPNRDPNGPDDQYSMISLPHYFIRPSKTLEGYYKIPGISFVKEFIRTEDSESFPEMWQNFLIVRGLLKNNLYYSAKNIILNLVHLLENRDFIPLSNRIYKTKRTQLPLFAFIVEDFLKARQEPDLKFLQEIIPAITKDFNWWINNAKVEITKGSETYILYRYKQRITGPRPEVYRSDHNLSKRLQNDDERIAFFSGLHAIEESAFGNSSRFYSDNLVSNHPKGIIIENLVTVELNSILQKCATLLASWYQNLRRTEEQTEYQAIADNIQRGIDNVLWSNNHGIWYDWNLTNKDHANTYYVTNLMGLLTSSYDKTKVNQVLKYLREEDIISQHDSTFNHFILPTSKKSSGLMGDYPYGFILWNVLAIDGLRQSENEEAKEVAKNIATELIRTMFKEYLPYGMLFEYYKIDTDIEEDEVKKMKGGSAAALGCIITLLDWYKEAEYDPDVETLSNKDIGTTSLKMKERDDNEDDSGKSPKKRMKQETEISNAMIED